MAAIVVSKQWNGTATSTRETLISLSLEPGGDIRILVDAPFHNDPAPLIPAGKCPDLHKYELVELFVGIGEFPTRGSSKQSDYSTTQYLEIGLGPHGHWYAIMFAGEANWSDCDQDLYFPTPAVVINKEEGAWSGEIRIPVSYVPEPQYLNETSSLKWMVNAFAIHGMSENREYMAFNPVSGPKPNFHQLKHFVPLEMQITKNATSKTNDEAIFRILNTKLNTNVNLNEVDDSSVSSDEDDDDEDSKGNYRNQRLLSGIPEEQSEEVSASNSNDLKVRNSSTTSADASKPSIGGTSNAANNRFKFPSKDWFNVNRGDFDPNAPQTLASFMEQYRGNVVLDRNFGRYMNDDEFAVLQGVLWKRKGWSYKKRVFLLTSKPRLLYLDESGKYKGTIPWAMQDQIEATKISESQFDISTAVSKRLYHLDDKKEGADRWVERINSIVTCWKAYLDYQKNRRPSLTGANPVAANGTASAPASNAAAGSALSVNVPVDKLGADGPMQRRGSAKMTGDTSTNSPDSPTPNEPMRRNSSRTNSAHSSQHNITPATSGTSITNAPLTVAEALEKYRNTGNLPRLANENLYTKFVHADEFVIMQAVVTKAQGILWKNRVLIVTSKPRILYLKRNGTFVGTIAWSMTTPISVKRISTNTFEITESVGKTTYQFTDSTNGADRWVNILKEICDIWAAYLKWQVGKVKMVKGGPSILG